MWQGVGAKGPGAWGGPKEHFSGHLSFDSDRPVDPIRESTHIPFRSGIWLWVIPEISWK